MSTIHGDTLKEHLKLRFMSLSTNAKPSEWIVEHTKLKQKPYSFKDHEYQVQFVDDKHKVVVAKKCAQIGFTELMLRWMLCFLVQHQGSQTIFTQPTDGDAGKFSKSRLDIVFEDCPIVKRLGTGGIDSVYLKRIGQSFFNLRGTFGAKAAISVPSDANVYDEVDFSNPRVLSQFKSRLQHSAYKFERPISTPTIPNFGVSALYDKSDQKRVIIKCSHCNHRQFLTWEENIRFAPRRGPGATRPKDPDMIDLYLVKEWEWRPYIACSKCEEELNRDWYIGKREWVAAYPDRAMDLDSGISGYQIGQLDVPFVAPSDIVKASDKRFPEGFKKEQDFRNFVLGLEYAGGDAMRIDDSVAELVTITMASPNAATGTFLGLDLGNTCHLVVIKDFWLPGDITRTPVVIAAIKFPKELLEDFYAYQRQFGTLYTVSDALPYTTDVAKTAKRQENKNKMKICFFGGKKQYTTSKDQIEVTANRTQMLDVITDGMPKKEIMVASGIANRDEFWQHLKNLARVKSEDDDGVETFEYVKIGEDHFAFATGYAMLARTLYQEIGQDAGVGLAPIEVTGARTTL